MLRQVNIIIIVFVETLRVSYCAMHNTRLRITQTTKLLQSNVADKHKLVRDRIYSAKTVITVFYNIDYNEFYHKVIAKILIVY